MATFDDVRDGARTTRLELGRPGSRGLTTPRRRAHLARLPLMALAALAMIAAVWGGLSRLGWVLPHVAAGPVAFHGPLMVSGFPGTLIGLERAVAAGRRWAYAAPLASGLGGLALIAGVPGPAGPLLITIGSAGLVLVFAGLLGRQCALFTVVMALGAVLWLVGQALWLAGWPLYHVVFWWASFLVLTIASERLELARLARVSSTSRAAFLGAISLVLAGLVTGTILAGTGVRVVGVGLVALALWLGRHDIARRTVRQSGLTRFIALALLVGYAWLGVAGALATVFGDVSAGPAYDAMLHAVFLGFVFSMIFGHAPIIFPAVVGIPVSYRPTFYAHLVLLHATLAIRVAGDLWPWLPGRQWGGLLNALAIAAFLANTAYGVLRPIRPTRTESPS
jgi:hypothetical protein